MKCISFLVFVLVFSVTNGKNLQVDANLTSQTGSTFPNLNEAITALLNGTFLIDPNNTITLLPTCVGMDQYFPNISIAGNSSIGGSISISFMNTPPIFQSMGVCGSIPSIAIAGNSFIQVSNLTSFSITGVNLKYSKANNVSTFSNISNLSISNFCFNNSEPMPNPNISDVFSIVNVSSFNMMNGIYLFDAIKMLLITQSSQITIDNIIFMALPTIVSNNVPAFNISNADRSLNTTFYASNIQLAPFPNSPNTVMPEMIWTENINFVLISSFMVASYNFNIDIQSSQAMTQIQNLISSSNANLVSITNFQLNSVQVVKNTMNSLYFISISAVPNVNLSNFNISNSILTTQSNSMYLVYISDNASGNITDYPMQIFFADWQIISCNFGELFQVIFIVFNEFDNYGGFNINGLEVSGKGSYFGLEASLISMQIQSNQTNTLEVGTKYFNMTNIYVSQTVLMQSTLMILSNDNSDYIPCVELIHVQINNSTFNNNTLNNSEIIRLNNVFLSITNFNASNSNITMSSNFILSGGGITTILISYLIVDSFKITTNSVFLSFSYQQTRSPALDEGYNNGINGIFAETAPFIIYNAIFNAITLNGSSLILQSANPMVIIQETNFTNITTFDYQLLIVGSYPIFVSSVSYYSGPLGPSVNDLITNENLSVFTAAENNIFANFPELGDIYYQTRDMIASFYPEDSIFFISIIDCEFLNVQGIATTQFLSFTDFAIPNATLILANNQFVNISSMLDTNVVYILDIETVALANNVVLGANVSGYLLYLNSPNTDNVSLINNSIIQSYLLSLYSIDVNECSELLIQGNYAFNVHGSQSFIVISCYQFNAQLVIKDCLFQNITLQNDPTLVVAVNFISFTTTLNFLQTDQNTLIIFTNNTFNNTSVLNIQNPIEDIYPCSLILIISANSLANFSMNAFYGVNIASTGNLMTISVQVVVLYQSNFTALNFQGADGAIYANLENFEVLDCNFIENVCQNYDCLGLFKLKNVNNMLNVTINNSVFTNNVAPYGTIGYIESSSLEMSISSSNFLNNVIALQQGLFSFYNLSNSSLIAKNLTFIQVTTFYSVPLVVFYFESNGMFVSFNLQDIFLEILGNTTGTFIYSQGGSPLNLTVSNLNLTSTNLSNITYDSIIPSGNPSTNLVNQVSDFGILQAENIKAVFQNLNVQNVTSVTNSLIKINCDLLDAIITSWELQIFDSNFQILNISESIISINSDNALSESLSNLSVLLQNTSFTNIISSSDYGAIITSTTPLIGNNYSDNYTILVNKCTFLNLNGGNGLIYAGVESGFDFIIWINDTIFEFINATGAGAILYGSQILALQTQISLLSENYINNDGSNYSENASSSSPTITYKLTQNTFKNISSTTGSIFYWESYTKAISFLASDNYFSTIISSDDGGLISAAYYPNITAFLSSNNSADKILEIMLFSNQFETIYTNGSGGIIYLNSNFDNQSVQSRILDSSSLQVADITITDNDFDNISAYQNGGVIFENALNNTLILTIQSNTFNNTSAGSRGGAFFFNQPIINITNNSFANFEANIAGGLIYSVSGQIDLSNFQDENVVENQSQTQLSFISFSPTNLKVEFVSQENGAILFPEAPGSSAEDIYTDPVFPNFTSSSLGDYQLYLTLVYNGLDFIEMFVPDESPANSSNVTLNFVSQDNSVQSYVSNNCSNSTCSVTPASVTLKGLANELILVEASYVSKVYSQFQQFYLRLRACIPGEINNTDTYECVYCSIGTYSLNPNDSKCQNCPSGAYCYGGTNITINKGFYQSNSSQSILILVACNDTDVPRCPEVDLNSINNSCYEPFSGPVCLQCDVKNGYLPTGKAISCSQCFSKAKLIIVSIAVFLASIFYQILMIVMTYKENKRIYKNTIASNSPAKELNPGKFLVILSTFFQVASIVASFNIGTLESLFNITENAGNSNNQLVFLLQCLFVTNNADPFNGLKFQIYFYIFSPIIKVLIVIVIEVIGILLTKKSQRRQERKDSFIRIGAVAVVLILLEQPSIIGILCKYLKCIQLDPYVEETFITGFTNISCSTNEYSFFKKAVVIPGLIFWAIVIPVSIFTILLRNRKNLFGSEPLKIILGNFLNSYSEDTYYWGLLIMVVKILVFVSNSVINSNNEVKILVYLLILNIYSSLLIHKQPYIHKTLNSADRYCYLSCMTMMMLVLLQSSIQDENVRVYCNILIVLSFAWAVGYILLQIFSLHARQIFNIIKNKYKRMQILKQTYAILKDYHNSNPNRLDEYSRRGAICLDLPLKLRDTVEFERDIKKSQDEERLRLSSVQRLTTYQRVANLFTKRTKSSSSITELSKKLPESSVGISIFSYSSNKIEELPLERGDDEEHHKPHSLDECINLDPVAAYANGSNTSYRDNEQDAEELNNFKIKVFSPMGLNDISFSLENIDKSPPYVRGKED